MVAIMGSGRKNQSSAQGKNSNSGVGERLRKSAVGLAEEASEKFSELTGAVKSEANRLVEEQKQGAARKIKNVGSAIEKAGKLLHVGKVDAIAEYVDMAASGAKEVSSYLEDSDLNDILEDAGKLAARHPIAVFGTLMIVGLAAGRFVKAAGSALEDE
jgi:hypothetical protein